MATEDHERYCRLTLLTHKGGKFVGEHILVRELGLQHGSPTLVAFLGSKKRYLKDKKYRHEITTHQFYILFPSDGTDTDVKNWDLHLLLKITLEFFTNTLKGQEDSDLREILRIRNKVSHVSELTMSESEFSKNMDILVKCIYRLSQGLDIDTAAKAITIIGDLRSGPLSSKESKEMMAQIGIHDECMKYVLDALTRFDTRQDDHSTKLNEILDRLDMLEGSMTSSETHQIHIPTVQTQLTISGDRDGNVTKANDLVIRDINAAIEDDDPNDKELINSKIMERHERKGAMVSTTGERDVKRTVKEMVQDIERKNAKVISAEKGSILINIQCKTLNGLRKLLRWLRDKEYRSCLQKIERALETNFQSKMDVDMTLSNGAILELTNWSVLVISKLINAKSEELPYKAKVNIEVKCQSIEAVSRVVKYLAHGDAANRLNTLSEKLSNAVGGRIRVHATPDMDKLLTDIKKVRTDLSTRDMSMQMQAQKTPDESQIAETKVDNEDTASSANQTLWSMEECSETTLEEVDDVRPKKYPRIDSPSTSSDLQSAPKVVHLSHRGSTHLHQTLAALYTTRRSNKPQATEDDIFNDDDPITELFGSLIDNRRQPYTKPLSYEPEAPAGISQLRIEGLRKSQPKNIDKVDGNVHGNRLSKHSSIVETECLENADRLPDQASRPSQARGEEERLFYEVNQEEKQSRINEVARCLAALGKRIAAERELDSADSSQGIEGGLSSLEKSLIKALRRYADEDINQEQHAVSLATKLMPAVNNIRASKDYSNFKNVIQQELSSFNGWEQVAWYTYLIKSAVRISETDVVAKVKNSAMKYFNTVFQPWIQSRPNGWESILEETDILDMELD